MQYFSFSRLLILALWLASWGSAYGASVALVLSERSAGYLDIAKAVAADLERTGLAPGEIVQLTAAELPAGDSAALQVKVFVTVGSEALRRVLALESRTPVVAALLPKSGFERLVREHSRRPAGSVSAVYLDQAFNRRVELLRLALPDAKRVGVLWGPDSVASQSSLAQALQARGLALESSLVADSGALFGGLKAVLEEADVLLAVADPVVYSSSTIANILLTTYRAGIPMLAFSPAYVKAGALLAIYATPQQIAMQAAGMARQVLQGAALPAPQYPIEFEISVNEHVARSLGLKIDAKTLTERLQATARRP
ncbi:MAG: hypothetical protein CFE43_05780 [Burkholderiales bacterium PBB3]|nr:MAG: hypothetical protein CFE43_05780 [Burkholderiales bacterium PBB3]